MTLHVVLKVKNSDNRGIYHEETERAIVFLPMHESVEDLYKTINHEVYHHCFAKMGESDDMDEDQEEDLIFNLSWAEFSL